MSVLTRFEKFMKLALTASLLFAPYVPVHADTEQSSNSKWIVKPAIPPKHRSLPIPKPTHESTDSTLSFVSPSEGRKFALGEQVNVKLNLTQQRQITSVTLYVDDSAVRSLFDPPFKWNSTRDAKLRDLPIGEYRLRATVKPYRGLPQHVTTQFSVVLNEKQAVVLNQATNILNHAIYEPQHWQQIHSVKMSLDAFSTKANINNFYVLGKSIRELSHEFGDNQWLMSGR